MLSWLSPKDIEADRNTMTSPLPPRNAIALAWVVGMAMFFFGLGADADDRWTTLEGQTQQGTIVAIDPSGSVQAADGARFQLAELVSIERLGIEPASSHGSNRVRLVGGSDWTVSSMNPLDAIQVALTRRPLEEPDGPAWIPEERVDLDAMLRAYTIEGAYLSRQEERTGSIEVGKRADLVLLERNLYEVPVEEIHRVRVRLTLLWRLVSRESCQANLQASSTKYAGRTTIYHRSYRFCALVCVVPDDSDPPVVPDRCSRSGPPSRAT